MNMQLLFHLQKAKKNAIISLEKFEKLKKKEVIIEQTEKNFHVLAGKYQSYREARKYLNDLNQMGYKGWIKKVIVIKVSNQFINLIEKLLLK